MALKLAGQAGQLVVARDLDGGVEILGGGHVLGRRGQPLDRARLDRATR